MMLIWIQGKWMLASGPLTEEEFNVSYLQTSKENKKLPAGKVLTKCAFGLSNEYSSLLKDSQLYVSNGDGKLFLALPVEDVINENDLDFELPEPSDSLLTFSDSKFGDSVSSFDDGGDSIVDANKSK
jgi:hypothetical protein